MPHPEYFDALVDPARVGLAVLALTVLLLADAGEVLQLGRDAPYHQRGGRSTIIRALRSRGWIDRDHHITAEGRKALAQAEKGRLS